MEEERKIVSSSEATYRLHYENELGSNRFCCGYLKKVILA